MEEFTGLQYLKIDIANCYGLNKLTWQERIDWTDKNVYPGMSIGSPKDPILFDKAIRAYRKAKGKHPIGHIMYLDSTASGLQLMAALSGCEKTALATNMIDPTKVYSPYTIVDDCMHKKYKRLPDYKAIKKATMCHYYNKQSHPEFTENQQALLQEIWKEQFPGCHAVQEVINRRWDPETLVHSWTLPDEHTAHVPVTEMVNVNIEIDELDVAFAYRYEKNMCSDWYGSLCPNILHSIDSYIAREMIRMASKAGFELVTIHDAYGSLPGNMNHIRRFYTKILSRIADTNFLEQILKQFGSVNLEKYSNNLSGYILNSEYMLN